MLKKFLGLRYVCFVYQKIKRPFVYSIEKLRTLTGKSKYHYLRKFKDKYKSKRCFIVCTGPSLSYADLDLIKNEISFGMNSLCLGFNKTEWRPTFFGVQDSKVFDAIKDVLKQENDTIVFCSSQLRKDRKNDIKDNWLIFPYNGIYNSYEVKFKKEKKVKFSNDITSVVYDGYSITYSLIQIAAYMGFSEIYLIGADCNYIPGKKNHFIEHGVVDPIDRQIFARELLIYSYSIAKEELEIKGIKVFNATRGGCLEIFPRVNLEDVVNN